MVAGGRGCVLPGSAPYVDRRAQPSTPYPPNCALQIARNHITGQRHFMNFLAEIERQIPRQSSNLTAQPRQAPEVAMIIYFCLKVIRETEESF